MKYVKLCYSTTVFTGNSVMESGLKHYAKLRSPALFTLQLCQLCLPYNTNYAKLIIFFFLFSGGFLPGGRVRAPSKIPKINDSELDERTIDSREMLCHLQV
ncbi:unnamed protein product [Lactuca virosa]|uniref:Uncharacterized protein n=1 Tax=Lactuca virosa TaxID=75947 RepID=A0AAU9MGA1_9ASTR|nr:unnamed protein product [Lactuca virosa]